MTHSRGFAPHSACPRQRHGRDRLPIFYLWLLSIIKYHIMLGFARWQGEKCGGKSMGGIKETGRRLRFFYKFATADLLFLLLLQKKTQRVRNDHGGTSRRERRLLSSVLTSSVPIRKRFAGLWIGFGETDHQALIFSSTCSASAAPASDTAPDGRAACRCTERPSPAARRRQNCPPGRTGRDRGRCY